MPISRGPHSDGACSWIEEDDDSLFFEIDQKLRSLILADDLESIVIQPLASQERRVVHAMAHLCHLGHEIIQSSDKLSPMRIYKTLKASSSTTAHSKSHKKDIDASRDHLSGSGKQNDADDGDGQNQEPIEGTVARAAAVMEPLMHEMSPNRKSPKPGELSNHHHDFNFDAPSLGSTGIQHHEATSQFIAPQDLRVYDPLLVLDYRFRPASPEESGPLFEFSRVFPGPPGTEKLRQVTDLFGGFSCDTSRSFFLLADLKVESSNTLADFSMGLNDTWHPSYRLPRIDNGYPCRHTGCNKVIHRASDHRKHEQIHIPEQERAHPCTYAGCPKRFRYPKDLKRHIKVHEKGWWDSGPVTGTNRRPNPVNRWRDIATSSDSEGCSTDVDWSNASDGSHSHDISINERSEPENLSGLESSVEASLSMGGESEPEN